VIGILRRGAAFASRPYFISQLLFNKAIKALPWLLAQKSCKERASNAETDLCNN
jgi:hypothetical protein